VIGHVTVASRKLIIASISFYCHDKFGEFIIFFFVGLKDFMMMQLNPHALLKKEK
jgi:hypothetical protein